MACQSQRARAIWYITSDGGVTHQKNEAWRDARHLKNKCRKHGEPWFSGTLVIGDPQEDEDKSADFFKFLPVFFGFSGWAFWKIIRAGLPHFFGPV